MTKQTLLVGIYSSAKIVQATSHTGFVSFIDHNDPQYLHKTFGSERTDAFNRWSLGDFTKMEGTQMEMFNFLWLIWDHYLPLTPTRND